MQAWVWWLLPFLVARAVVPVGFMAQAVDGRMQIVFCQSGVMQLRSVNKADVTATLGQSHDQSSSHGQNDFSCPFAHAAAAPLLDVSGSEAIAFIPQVEILPPAEPPYQAAGPPRFIATRGPPILV